MSQINQNQLNGSDISSSCVTLLLQRIPSFDQRQVFTYIPSALFLLALEHQLPRTYR